MGGAKKENEEKKQIKIIIININIILKKIFQLNLKLKSIQNSNY